MCGFLMEVGSQQMLQMKSGLMGLSGVEVSHWGMEVGCEEGMAGGMGEGGDGVWGFIHVCGWVGD